jgi:chromosome segregation ATPase
MTTLNKVLAVLNVLAAIGFLCLAGMDYSKRHAWMFAVRQQDFIIDGLPVDDAETDADGHPLVAALGTQMQKQLLFGVMPEAPVKTLKEEVQRRHQALLMEIEDAPNPEAKRQIIEASLVPLARTWGQRDELRRKIRDPKITVDTLVGSDGPLEAAFKDANEGKTLAEEQVGPDARRLTITHLLFNLSDKPDDHRRTLAVVGLRAYIHEVDSQATALRNMAPEIQHAMEADLTAFEIEHKDLIRQIENLAERVREANSRLETQKAFAQSHETRVAARKADVQSVQAEIAEAKKATDVAMNGQSRLENALFQARAAIAAAGEKNQQLLQEIRTKELGR